jgi:hypothetical protein
MGASPGEVPLSPGRGLARKSAQLRKEPQIRSAQRPSKTSTALRGRQGRQARRDRPGQAHRRPLSWRNDGYLGLDRFALPMVSSGLPPPWPGQGDLSRVAGEIAPCGLQRPTGETNEAGVVLQKEQHLGASAHPRVRHQIRGDWRCGQTLTWSVGPSRAVRRCILGTYGPTVLVSSA